MYASCIIKLVKCSRASEALGILDRMSLAGVKPKVFCITSALNAHVKVDQLRDALCMLRKMPSLGVAPQRRQLHYGDDSLWVRR